jgi:hypothetical protein
MKKLLQTAALGLVALGFSLNASAGPVSFESTVHQLEYIGNGDHKTYWHNLVNEGFVVGTHVAQSFDLFITLFDDLDLLQGETVSVNVAAGSSEAQYGSLLNLYLPSFSVYGSTLAQALLQITDTGLLSVKISSVRGDFYLGNSYLRVNAWAPNGNVAVAEPGMLMLMLAGLAAVAGIAITRRRRPARALLLKK